MRIPGPNDLVNAVGWVGDSVETLTGLLPRVVALIDSAEDLVERVHQIVDRAESTVNRTDAIVDRVEGVVGGAEDTVARTNRVVKQAEDTVKSSTTTLNRAGLMIDQFEPQLTQLHPIVAELARTTDPDEVAAMVQMVNMLPELTESMRDDILPMLKTLDTVGPDLRELLLATQQFNEVLGAIPGLGRAKKRVEQEQAEEADKRPDPGHTATDY